MAHRLAVGLDWAVIVAAIVVSQLVHNPVVYVAAVVVTGGRMHAFGVLLHEFAHYRFLNNRKELSDWVCELTLAWPVLTTVAAYRRNHLAHHRYTNTDKDPDWVIKLGNRKFVFPQQWQSALGTMLSYIAVFGSVLDVFMIARRLKALDTTPRSYRILRLSYYVAWALLFTLTGSWLLFLFYWVVPYLTTFFLLMYIRSVAEHFGSMDYDGELTGTRTVLPFFWEKAFFSPHNVNFHLDHHLYPSVPFYRLPELHAALMQNAEFAAHAHLTRGYTYGLVRETLTWDAGKAVASPAPSPAE